MLNYSIIYIFLPLLSTAVPFGSGLEPSFSPLCDHLSPLAPPLDLESPPLLEFPPLSPYPESVWLLLPPIKFVKIQEQIFYAYYINISRGISFPNESVRIIKYTKMFNILLTLLPFLISNAELFPFEGDEVEVLYGDFWGLSSYRLEESGRGFPIGKQCLIKS